MKWDSNAHKDSVAARVRVKLHLAGLDAEERAYLLERLDNAAAGSPSAIWNLRGELHDLGLPREPQV